MSNGVPAVASWPGSKLTLSDHQRHIQVDRRSRICPGKRFIGLQWSNKAFDNGPWQCRDCRRRRRADGDERAAIESRRRRQRICGICSLRNMRRSEVNLLGHRWNTGRVDVSLHMVEINSGLLKTVVHEASNPWSLFELLCQLRCCCTVLFRTN